MSQPMRPLRVTAMLCTLLVVACGSSSSGGTPAGGDVGDGGRDTAGDGGDGGGTTRDGGRGAGDHDGGGGEDASGPSCLGNPGDPCGNCLALHCCPQLAACANDPTCEAAALCVAACHDGTAACFQKCGADADATFAAYGTCAVDHGCACGN